MDLKECKIRVKLNFIQDPEFDTKKIKNPLKANIHKALRGFFFFCERRNKL